MTALDLAKRLVEFDEDRVCPFCSKDDWGKDLHSDNCPFAMAYKIIDEAEAKAQ